MRTNIYIYYAWALYALDKLYMHVSGDNLYIATSEVFPLSFSLKWQ